MSKWATVASKDEIKSSYYLPRRSWYYTQKVERMASRLPKMKLSSLS
jgi:hypothetical protein